MQTATEQRRAFAIWLRTGRWVRIGGEGAIEFKFNPWHDPSNGRFTFAGTGSASKAGSGLRGQRKRKRVPPYGDDPKLKPITSLEEADAWRASELAKHPGDPDWREAIEVRYRHYRNQFSLPPSSPPPSPLISPQQEGFVGGGGQGGGGGASGSWETPSGDNRSADAHETRSGMALASRAEERTWRHVSRNGYDYQIDERDRTRRVSGVLVLAPSQPRSRSLQRGAGGADRLPTDDGGHYIASRFNGPTEAFNYFAQDASVNRGKYRALEDQWARAKRVGSAVTVKIVPHFRGTSQRPMTIDVVFNINGRENSVKLPNERGVGRHGD
ncbi:DNA/RNA non-specific endonuclease [uncultured Sphingomonas sp.]|uniref:DNA/RNA non-specific endonuclease n=1 Tax=uncultured Sphingomonas sp. TaxID=158754 RepID=UPI0025DC26A4|nr:DNA/RNA non-specific endonuclease [uncultured Sphingomonas sp.]